MVRYILNKAGNSLAILLGVITLIFMLFNVLPGDPARMMLGQRADSISLEAVRKDLGLDRPVHMQYVKYLNDLSPISFHEIRDQDHYFYLEPVLYAPAYRFVTFSRTKAVVFKQPYLRRSYQSRKDVSSILSETIGNTFILAFTAILFASLAGIALGILCAVSKDKLFYRSMLVFSALGMSLPSFFAAILVGWVFAYLLGDFTGLNLTGNLFVIDDFGEGTRLVLKNLILPAFTLGIRPLSVITQLSRNSMLEVLGQDYIRTARAKGLSFRQVILGHALKNSLNPVMTAASGWFASMMAGVIFVEYIFGWKGLGYILVDALNNYDLPLVLGCVMTISVVFILVNLLVDIGYTLLDPRVRIA